MRPGRPPSAPLILPGTHHEQRATLAVSLAARRVFLLTEQGGKNQLVAYQPAPAGLDEAWRVEVPELTTLARDPGGRTVLALCPATRGLDITVLGPDPAHLDASSVGHLELGRDEAPFLFSEWGRRDGACRAHASCRGHRADPRGKSEALGGDRSPAASQRDPTALAMLVGAVLSRPHPEIAERLLAIALDQHQDTHVAIRPSRVGSLRPLRSRPSHRLRLRRPTGTSRITSRRSATR